MNSIVFIAFFAVLITGTISIDCGTGYFSNPAYSALNMCYKCPDIYSECAAGFVVGTKISASNVVGYKYAANGDLVKYCPNANVYTATFYNKNENVCEIDCKEGCKECSYDYDYCIQCYPGYVWNNYTCAPIAVGIQGASLAILAISLIFGLIACIFVIRAKKN